MYMSIIYDLGDLLAANKDSMAHHISTEETGPP